MGTLNLCGSTDRPQPFVAASHLTFTLSLMPHPPDSLNPGSQRILIVEDNPVNQKVMMRLLQKLGYSVTVVGNGQEAVAVAQQDPYDVVLMDINMPVMGGIEATRQIRQLPGSQPWIIAMTAESEGDLPKAMAGMNDFVSKPIIFEQLQQALARIPR